LIAKRKILFVSHNHPVIRPGGAEGYALELYKAMRDSDSFEPIFLARTGPPMATTRQYHLDTPFTSVNEDPNQYFLYTDLDDYDWLNGRSRQKRTLTKHFRDFLLAHQPDIVHFQHSYMLGYDAIRVVRNTLPHVPIVYTLHEYLSICHRNGQMLRAANEELCSGSSPRRCHECFPDTSPQAFFMRERFIQSQFSLVDLFIVPNPNALERFVDWGIPRGKIVAEPYGKLPVTNPAKVEARQVRNQFGFFGQLLRSKGISVLLRAVELAAGSFDGHVWIHGSNLDLQPQTFQDEFGALLERTRRNVTMVGRYEPDELPELMEKVDWVVVPSLWWETGPLVVYEAFQHGRPVICSDIDAMAEKVEDGVSGLHFHRGDAHDLASVLERATDPQLWEQLRGGIPNVHSMDNHMATLSHMYEALIREQGAHGGRTSRLAVTRA
jgi:glycosyltransferase involved in cell wall biosynthesis